MSAESALIKARSQLIMDQPFYGTLSLRLRLLVSEDIKTAATDGTSLIYNPEFILKQDAMQLRGLIAHEVQHCVFNHHTRRQERDPELWNIACDYAINNYLIKCDFILPKNALVDPAYDGMSAEQIYSKLQSMPKKPKPCPWGMVLDSKSSGINAQSPAESEAQWQIAVGEAIAVAKARGKLPGGMEQFVENILAPKVDWRSILWPWFTELTKDDYSWRKPNRAYISEDEYLPSMHDEGCGKIAVVFDTSGSVPDEAGEQFFAEVDAVIDQTRPSSVVFIQADAAVRSEQELDHNTKLANTEKAFKGRGGTAFTPAFELIREKHNDVQAIVYLTDLESSPEDFDQAEKAATAPVLWVSIVPRNTAPFGTTAYMTI